MRNSNIRSDIEVSAKTQYYAAFVVNIMCFAHGCTTGWVSPSLPLLLSPDSPLGQPLTATESYLVASSVCITATFCTPLFGWIADRFGRKTGLFLSGMFYIIAWAMKLMWLTSTSVIVARFLVGIGGAGIFMLAPIYCVEIASIDLKGTLSSLMTFSINGGILFMYILGEFFNYTTIVASMIPLPIIFVVLMYFLPETPAFLLKRGKIADASKSLGWLRSVPTDSVIVRKEIESIKNDMSVDEMEKGSIWQMFKSSNSLMKAFTVLLTLVTINCCMGSFAIVSYAEDIFEKSGTDISPSTCSIILGCLLIIGSFVASSLVEKLGRKILLISSCLIVGISMFTMAVFFHLQNTDVNLDGWRIVPVIALSTALCTFSMGAGPIPYILPSEILPVQVRSAMTSIILTWVWFLSFLVAAGFGPAVSVVGMSGVFIFFGLASFSGVVLTVFSIPETKGKSVEQSMAFYGDRNKATLQSLCS